MAEPETISRRTAFEFRNSGSNLEPVVVFSSCIWCECLFTNNQIVVTFSEKVHTLVQHKWIQLNNFYYE